MKNSQKISIFILLHLTRSRLPRPFEPVLIWLQLPTPAHKQSTQKHPTHESTYVRPPRSAADLLRTGQCRRAAEQLDSKPEDKIKYGWDLKQERKKKDWKQNK